MTREYLLKVIEKHFFVLSKKEIAEQIGDAKLQLPDWFVEALQKQDPMLDDEERRRYLHPLFYAAVEDVRASFDLLGNLNFLIWDREKLFDNTLLVISIFYHYPAVLLPNVMVDFLRDVLLKKILLT